MDDKAQLLVAVMGAGGGGAALLAFINGMFKWLSGASHREQVRDASIEKQRLDAIKDRNKAEDERDTADKKRREAEEHVAILKAQLREHNITPRERI